MGTSTRTNTTIRESLPDLTSGTIIINRRYLIAVVAIICLTVIQIQTSSQIAQILTVIHKEREDDGPRLQPTFVTVSQVKANQTREQAAPTESAPSEEARTVSKKTLTVTSIEPVPVVSVSILTGVKASAITANNSALSSQRELQTTLLLSSQREPSRLRVNSPLLKRPLDWKQPAQSAPEAIHGTILRGPIFLMSLPKSGTSSVHSFFRCGKMKSSHGYAKLVPKKIVRVGPRWAKNVATGRPLLEGLETGNYTVWTDEGIPDPNEFAKCFYPSFDALDNIAQFYPYATIMMVVREKRSWLASAKKWDNGRLLKRMKKNCKDFPNKGATDDDWLSFYDNHTAHVRRFSEHHPTLTYLELPLESSAAIMEESTGVSASCWKHCNPASRKCVAVNATTV